MLHKTISKDNICSSTTLTKKDYKYFRQKTLTAVKRLKIDDRSHKAVYRVLEYRDPSCFNRYANFLAIVPFRQL